MVKKGAKEEAVHAVVSAQEEEEPQKWRTLSERRAQRQASSSTAAAVAEPQVEHDDSDDDSSDEDTVAKMKASLERAGFHKEASKVGKEPEKYWEDCVPSLFSYCSH